MELYDSILMVVKQVTEQGQAGSWGTHRGNSPPSFSAPLGRACLGGADLALQVPQTALFRGFSYFNKIYPSPPPGTHTVEVVPGGLSWCAPGTCFSNPLALGHRMGAHLVFSSGNGILILLCQISG